MIRLLLLVIVGFLVYSVLVALLRGLGPRPKTPPREKSAQGEPRVKGPVCGTYLPRSDALIGNVAGETRYYCSRECRERDQQT